MYDYALIAPMKTTYFKATNGCEIISPTGRLRAPTEASEEGL